MANRTVLDELELWFGETPELFEHYREEHLDSLARFMKAVESGEVPYLPELHEHFGDFLVQIAPSPRECRWHECWEWQGDQLEGYGILRHGRALFHAHRLSVCLAQGQSFSQLQTLCRTRRKEVCHTCENRACVNPHHLLLASHRHNMWMAKRSGRLKPPGDWRRKEREYLRCCWFAWSFHFEYGQSWEDMAQALNLDRARLIAMAREVHPIMARGQTFPD